MNDKLEVKKDSLRQMQGGEIKLGFTIQHADMPDFLYSDPMGKRYYVVFIDADYYDESNGVVKESLITEQIEGERLRTMAVMLCKDSGFQKYVGNLSAGEDWQYVSSEDGAIGAIYDACNIKSRSELATNKNAQDAFHVLLRDFREWKTSQDYADNLSR